MLTKNEVEFYQQNGFLGVQRQLFSSEKFATLHEDVNRLVAQELPQNESNTLTSLQTAHPQFLNWAASPEILDQVEQLIGPDIALWAITMFVKRANSEKFVDWHCDSKVLQAYKAFESLDHVALLVAMSPNTLQQGCVRYIPGTHLDKRERRFNDRPYEGSLFGGVIYSLHEEEYKHQVQEAVPVELQMGEYSFHDIHSIHASDPNQSAEDRILLNFKYFPTHIVPRPDKVAEKIGQVQQCYLLRGQDRSNRGLLMPYSPGVAR